MAESTTRMCRCGMPPPCIESLHWFNSAARPLHISTFIISHSPFVERPFAIDTEFVAFGTHNACVRRDSLAHHISDGLAGSAETQPHHLLVLICATLDRRECLLRLSSIG